MLVLLLDILESQQDASAENKLKALLVLRNVMAQLRREEASPAAPQLLEKLLPLFDEVRLLWEPEPHGRALCKEGCPPAQPCGSRRPGPFPSSCPGALAGMASGLCSPARLLPGRLMPAGDLSPLCWGNLWRGLAWARGPSAAPADLAHSSCVHNLAPEHLPWPQPR